jgi:two-component system, chemotaxis family, CheB/CheR fusion protein
MPGAAKDYANAIRTTRPGGAVAKRKKPVRADPSGSGKPRRVRSPRPDGPVVVAPVGDEPADKHETTVVGIGASAGGLAALRQFFRKVADDSGLAYVVVVHLSPEHESHLATLLQPHSKMRVVQVQETMPLEPNCVYVIPPNANLDTIDTHLRVSALERRREERAPIDHFFRTLAETHDGHAVGVILTGTGSDGSRGIKEIKLRGGLTVVQDPNEAEYDGMPQSAVATGFADLVLPLAKIPAAVLRFARTRPRLPAGRDAETLEGEQQALLQKVLAQVRARTGRDFARYKRATIMRRIQRRMQLRYVEELDRYLRLLRETPEEVRALSDDLLINVTSFFRDPAVFEQLQAHVIPRLFDGRGPDDEIRAWCIGCATGEEVYSVAMLMTEETRQRGGLAPRIQLFASDLHERSLEMAREGFYPGDIATEVSRERLNRYFIEEKGGYRIRKELRELVVFAPHNLLSDPPFSRLDLIFCRNLLIYLQRDVQGDVLRTCHYALNTGGYLVLGTSETLDDSGLFRTIDKEHSIYRRSNGPTPHPQLPAFPATRAALAESGPPPVPPTRFASMHHGMLEQYAPSSALVSPDGQVAHLLGQAGRYFEHPVGRLTTSIARLVRKELSVELVAALHAARREQRTISTHPIPVQFNGERHPVTMHVHPATATEDEGYSLVIFEELPEAQDAAAESEGGSERMAELSNDLDITRQRLQSVIEEFETSQEEMKASNEELQSTNEELRSTMEELETSKEELQSMNEELQTVNQENRHKVEELASLTGDLQNLLASTDIATLFLDRELRILRFTPKIEELFNVRLTDRGRPISDLTHRLGYASLRDDADLVLKRLERVEREVRDEAGRWYLTHLLPYRSAEERIEGVVITFVDITRRKRSEEELAQLTKSLEQRVLERTRQVRDLTTSLVRAEQRERRRLSEALHDELQQLLYGTKLKLAMLRDAAGDGRNAKKHIAEAEELLGRGIQLTRQLSVDLNPPVLKSEGLRAILSWLQSHMRELHGLDVEIEAEGEIRVDDGDVRVLLFQVFRELLFNISKHAGVDSARVSLRESNGELVVDVKDQGKGFDVATTLTGRAHETQGLTSVKERIGFLGGHMEISSQPRAGTSVTLRIPKRAWNDG